MCRVILCCFISIAFSFSAKLEAQIYADVHVSHGETDLGTFRILLHHDVAPRTVANFIGLATGQRKWIDPQTGLLQINEPYYDGLTFHRLDHDFVLQGGDPVGNGLGGPGYFFQDEFDASLTHLEYSVSMANSGALANGSQFFVMLSERRLLDNKHSVFGTVINDSSYPNSRTLIDGFKDISNFPTTSERPNTPITIESITISGPDLLTFDIFASSLELPEISVLPIQIKHDTEADSFSLKWIAQRKFDYPLYFGTDLESWKLAGKVLIMDDNPNFSINIDSIAQGPDGFYHSTQIDYSFLHEAPQNILASGTVLSLSSNGGTLELTFAGGGTGEWKFRYENEAIPADSGLITSAFQANSQSYPVIPTSGTFINSSGQSYARFMAIRQITVFLDSEAGPDRLTAVEPVLSFHEESSGWFDGRFNSPAAGQIVFRGPFTIEQP